ncbi:MAG: hypothetical protein LC799_16310, partial [Actinobacteria bacterium]|nr:hypothetical protein [Actinomycetota bacterium]
MPNAGGVHHAELESVLTGGDELPEVGPLAFPVKQIIRAIHAIVPRCRSPRTTRGFAELPGQLSRLLAGQHRRGLDCAV